MATTEKTTKTAKATTSRRKSTPAGKTKSADSKPAAAKPSTAAKTQVTGVTDTPDAPEAQETAKAKVAPAGMFKMQELMAALEGKSELKRGELRHAVGLVLEALGTALHEGHDLALPGLGKITAKRRESKPNGDQIVARIKLGTAAPGPIRTATQVDE